MTMNSTNSTSKTSCNDAEQFYSYTVEEYALIAICLLGILGNILSFVVFHKKCPKSGTNSLFKSLAVTDCLFLLLHVVYATVDMAVIKEEHLSSISPTRQRAAQIGHMLLREVSWTAQWISIWLTVLLSFTRFVAVCLPLYASTLWSHTKARVAVSTTMVLCCLLYLPYCFFHQFKPAVDHDQATNTTYEFTRLYSTHPDWYRKWYLQLALINILFTLMPFLLLIVFNACIITTMCRRGHTTAGAASHHSNQQDARDVTVVSLAIVLVFMVSYLPALTRVIILVFESEQYESQLYAHSCLYVAVYHGGVIGRYVNSSVNFIIYFLARKSFRAQLLEFCGTCC